MTHSSLPTPLRRSLEKTMRDARVVAEAGAAAAIRRLGIEEAKAPAHLDDAAKALRRRLRAHARTLGDEFDRSTERQEVRHLIEAAAYAHWHRMLFARFLAERNLLRHPGHDVPVSLADCEELAPEESLPDGWAVAERYAAAMLPAVFQPDDPVLALELAPEHQQALHGLARNLDPAVFQASDSLGWTYQFWRAAEKDAVNKAGGKIGADELPAVTQLFTEPYMVRFLLHNALGAWWAGKVLAAKPELARSASDENALRIACALPGVSWDMLRFIREEDAWRPAAGTFPGWPTEAKTITLLDPCCGSGQFLTEALPMLAALRQAEEGLSPRDVVAAVLRDNLFGLELDGRCVQIAAFAVALAAWSVGGWQSLPLPHIAWAGAPPPLPRAEFVALANGDLDLAKRLGILHELFVQAPTLGSLIDPSATAAGTLFSHAQAEGMERAFAQLVERLKGAEPERQEGAIAARGMADAAAILGRHYTLQATNVPYLGRGKQAPPLADFIGNTYPDAKADLATAMLARMVELTAKGGTVATVTPQNWLFLGSYKKFRSMILFQTVLNVIATLGEEAWEAFGQRGPLATLCILSQEQPHQSSSHVVIDATQTPDRSEKISFCRSCHPRVIQQMEQIDNPDSRISTKGAISGELLAAYADVYVGFQNGDTPRWVQMLWEHPAVHAGWHYFQLTTAETTHFDGRNSRLRWDNGRGDLAGSEQVLVKGTEAWGKRDVIIRQMRTLPASLYVGDMYDQSSSVIVPKDQSHVAAIAAFVLSEHFPKAVRHADPSVAVTNATFVKVPFDLGYWQEVATARYSNGLPEPYSDDPTQWLFHGHPAQAEAGTTLHVALARLCGYRWPTETDREMRLSDEARAWIARTAHLPAGDDDGILCLPAVAGERSLADRLRAYLAIAFGEEWSDAKERRLIAEADARFENKAVKDASLEGWLRDRAFRQHCALFHQRPFLWHVWDGTRDGFAVFLHYHRLGRGSLEKLTYTTLGDWMARARAEDNTLRQEKGRELQQALEKILEGEKPFDIFVRWKGLERLPLGWDPDLDDGVRMNIRPFVKADILRDTPNIKWTKDRGQDVKSAPWYPVFKGERINDHNTLATGSQTRSSQRSWQASLEPGRARRCAVIASKAASCGARRSSAVSRAAIAAPMPSRAQSSATTWTTPSSKLVSISIRRSCPVTSAAGSPASASSTRRMLRTSRSSAVRSRRSARPKLCTTLAST